MNVTDFTEDKQILLTIDELQKLKQANPDRFRFSEIIDQAGHQYVDLVQEGGGVLGMALLGYTYVLEQMGIRFLKLAGTSAGAINTVLLGAAGRPQEAKSIKIIDYIANTNLYDFVDGDSDAREFIDALNREAGFLTMAYRGIQILDNLKDHLGLNPGDRFFDWLKSILYDFGVETTADLDRQLWDLPNEILQLIGKPKASSMDNPNWQLAIIAADITTETKAVFPQMGHLYFQDPATVNPAYYVRASMSVPLFFSPLTLDNIPDEAKNKLAWQSLTNYIGPHPNKVMFVDGGIMSNFPIDVFHVHDKVPQRPTFGVKLGLDRHKINPVESVNYKNLIGSCFNAARNIRDTDFINSNPDYQKLVCHIETGNHNWLNFELSNKDKLDLFRRGAKSAANFLKSFNWKSYQDLRRNKLFSIASTVLGKDISYFTNKLNRAEKVRSIYSDTEQRETLIKRLQFLEVIHQKVNILWIDDSISNDQDVIEVLISMGAEISFATFSDEAEQLLHQQKFEFDCIVSDIKRGDHSTEGIEFLKYLNTTYGNVPPTIFYITNFDASLGTPPYAFGITNSPMELVHLVADILQRKV